jgi:tRNA A-37 threonylcarbamoyl transferase component Bud32
MHDVKDTARALVRIGYDGRVHKTFRGHLARERFENEVNVLTHLEARGCNFVPKILEADADALKIVTTNCGKVIEHISEERMKEIYAQLASYGVRHEDAFMRNITYRASDGLLCVIDFEFATLLDHPGGRGLAPSAADTPPDDPPATPAQS